MSKLKTQLCPYINSELKTCFYSKERSFVFNKKKSIDLGFDFLNGAPLKILCFFSSFLFIQPFLKIKKTLKNFSLKPTY